MAFEVPELHNESMRAIVLARKKQPSHHNSVCRCLPKPTRPPLGSCEGWRVDDELVRRLNKGCRCFESTQKGAMAKLCLSVCSCRGLLSVKRDRLRKLCLHGQLYATPRGRLGGVYRDTGSRGDRYVACGAPMISSELHFGSSSLFCSSVPWPRIVGMNICTRSASDEHTQPLIQRGEQPHQGEQAR